MSHGLAGSRILLVGLGATLVVFAISYALSAPYSPEFYQSWIDRGDHDERDGLRLRGGDERAHARNEVRKRDRHDHGAGRDTGAGTSTWWMV